MLSIGLNKEQRILAQFARGDQRAMDVLYATYADYLTGVASRYIRQPDNLHDVMQEALIKVFTSIQDFEYRGKGSLKAWLTRVVINEALIFLRQNKRLNETDIDALPDMPEEEPPDTSGLTPEQAKALIDQLPDGYRAVFNLYAIEGKSHKEIAELLHIKPDTSASQYHRAKNMLARLIRQQYNQPIR
ncbi:MAG: sigma-70 family RNA polymerase sigma factor [Prevotella sp.]|nr:sigma-70 family RNA polymerase sigma factor [Prevotella sp.]